MNVITVNAGSSSLRLAAYRLGQAPFLVADAHFSPRPDAKAKLFNEFIASNGLPVPDRVVHRIVHGGMDLTEPCQIDLVVESKIEKLKTLAPLHNAEGLDWIRAARTAFGPDCPQFACFDTGFYANLPRESASYALPEELLRKFKIRRYGFHGLAHQSMLRRWRTKTDCSGDWRVISLQLGSGCSITASLNGQPIDTSMGFSPLGGLIMATRSGDMDPAVVFHLIDEGGYSSSELTRIFNEYSGLRAIAGQSGDMKTLLASEDRNAALAVAMFCHRVRIYLGGYLALLGGADAILFGGGIGEGAPEVRKRVLMDLGWAGIVLDSERNVSVKPAESKAIHAENSESEIWVIPPDEAELMVLMASGVADAELRSSLP